MVPAVLYGDGYSGCRVGVEVIRDIRRCGGRIVVQVDTLPNLGIGKINCAMMVQPLQLVEVSRSSLPVDFVGHVPIAGQRRAPEAAASADR
ncbi:MAG: hypothetical protein HZB25_13430 [Candidatus Eisenbacteria bacterium]|nr:hypothetical protein [Candidatus Eisenbacteria bacterium]